MSDRKPPYFPFFGAAFVAFVVISEGCEVFARMQIGGQPLAHALSETTHYAVIGFLGTIVSMMPFAAIAWICASLAKDRLTWAISLMGVCIVAFGLLYFRGSIAAQAYLLQSAWTAAALAKGFVPFQCVPIVLLAGVLHFALARKVSTIAA